MDQRTLGFSGIVVSDETYEEPYYTGNTWVIMTRAPEQFSHPNFQEAYIQPIAQNRKGFQPWTDDYSNIVKILK